MTRIMEIATQINNQPVKLKLKLLFILGYSYREADDEFVSGFKELLIDKGFDVIDGKADGLGSVSGGFLSRHVERERAEGCIQEPKRPG